MRMFTSLREKRPEITDWMNDPEQMAAYERRQAEPSWEEQLWAENAHLPEVEFTDPLWRCTYCGVSDKALEACPSCGAPRHWR